MGQIF